MTRSLTVPWPDHLLTLEEWDALPETDGVRLELVEGVIAMSPAPLFWHLRAGSRLSNRLDDQLPANLVAVTEGEVVLTGQPLTVRRPDVLVTHTELYEANPARVTGAGLLLAVEVLSDGTRRVDRVLKLSEYAEAGIPQYWIIDLDAPASLLSYTLVDGTYELSGEHTGVVDLEVAGHRFAIDLADLTRR
ncbi:Uma2 family endonuclease [Pseudonocardia sp. DLS-67]